MKNKKMFKILNLFLFILFHIILNVIAKKKSQIIILGGGGGGGHGPMPYMHSHSSSPSFIPIPIPIPMYQPTQQSYMPPIFIQQQPMSIPSPSHYHHMPSQPATQHIYHHHQNNQPQVHFVQLPIYKREKYQPEYKTINTSGHYQSGSEQYPVYSDYSYEYASQPNIHRRNGLEFDSFISKQQFINQNDHSKCRREQQLIEKIRREKYLRQKKERESKKKKYLSTIKNEQLINKYEYHLLNDNKTELNLDKN